MAKIERGRGNFLRLLPAAIRLGPQASKWLWLFPVAFVLHVAEETKGLGVVHGINLSVRHFVILTTITFLSLTCGIIVARKYGFPQLLSVCLATAVLLNALSHIADTIVFRSYDAGVITGILIFIPLGLVTLVALRKSMRWQRYAAGAAIGVMIQVAAMILAW